MTKKDTKHILKFFLKFQKQILIILPTIFSF
jgi:hypothetical protein